jgi:hypothetical protein
MSPARNVHDECSAGASGNIDTDSALNEMQDYI